MSDDAEEKKDVWMMRGVALCVVGEIVVFIRLLWGV